MIVALAVSCSKKPVTTDPIEPSVITKVKVPTASVSNFLPNATAFKMSGNYSKNVGITLNPDGSVLYFPAPSDITADSEPIDLGDGWWLNCQGLGLNSVFTKYTFSEYAAMSEAPSPHQLLLEVIPGAKVTQMIELPMTLSEAQQNIEAAKESIKNQ